MTKKKKKNPENINKDTKDEISFLFFNKSVQGMVLVINFFECPKSNIHYKSNMN